MLILTIIKMSNLKNCINKLYQHEIINSNLKNSLILKVEIKEFETIKKKINKVLKKYKKVCKEVDKLNLNPTNKKINIFNLEEIKQQINYKNKIVFFKNKVIEELKNKFEQINKNKIINFNNKLNKIINNKKLSGVLQNLKNNVINRNKQNKILNGLNKLNNVCNIMDNKIIINSFKNNVKVQIRKNKIIDGLNKLNKIKKNKISDNFRFLKNLFNIYIEQMENFNNIILDFKTGFNTIIDKNLLLDQTRKDENIIHKIGVNNSLNDTANINWYEGKEKIQFENVNYLSDIFCDNILLFVVDMPIIENGEEAEDKQIIKSKNCELNNAFISKFLTNNNIAPKDHKLKLLRMEKEEKQNPITEEHIKLYNEKWNENISDKKQLIKQIIKISLPNVNYKTVIKIFNDNKQYLNKNLFYFYDIDFTQDISGAFNKTELINMLLKRNDFYIEKSEEEKYEEETEDKNKYEKLEDDEKIIMKNNATVGKHCLTFLYNYKGSIIRCKFYNKFIDNLECGGVSKITGSNIKNWAYNEADTRLQNTVLKGVNCGVLRLESTYKFMPTLEDIKNINLFLEEILLDAQEDEIYFYCPIATQWTNYLKNAINENTILINTADREILFIRSVNKLTQKISGVYMSKRSGKKATTNKDENAFKHNLCFVISYLCFKNKPINIINVFKHIENKKINKITLNLNCYKITEDKNTNNEYNYLCNTNINYWKPKNKNYSHLLDNTGLINYGDYKFIVPDAEIRQYKFILLKLERIETTKNLNVVSYKNKQKILTDEKYENNKQEELKQIIKENENKKNLFLEKEKLKLDLEKDANNYLKIFKNRETETKNLLNMSENYKFAVIAINKIKDTEKYNLLCMDEQNKYYFKSYANTQINNYFNKVMESEENKNKFYFNNNLCYFVFANKIINFAEIQKFKNEYNAQRNQYAKLNIKLNKLFYNKQEEEEKAKDENLINIKLDVLGPIKNYKKFEELEENKKYFITNINDKIHGKNKKFICDLKDEDNKEYINFVSNAYAEDIINNFKIETTNIFKNTPYLILKTKIIKSHIKTKTKLMDLIIEINEDYINKLTQNYKNITEINETNQNLTTFNKKEFFKKIDEEYEKINENFKTLNTDYLKSFLNTGLKYKDKYKIYDEHKYNILSNLEHYLSLDEEEKKQVGGSLD